MTPTNVRISSGAVQTLGFRARRL